MSGEDPEIVLDETKSGGVYRVLVDGSTAEMTFSRANEHLIIIDHTDVPDALRGRKIGNLLLERVIADARASGTKIIPLCPFAASQFRSHLEYRDVLQ